MFGRNNRLIPTTEKGELATPLWTDNEFKSLLGEHMDLTVSRVSQIGFNKEIWY